MFGVLFFTPLFTLVCASDRRSVNQINNLRENLSYVNNFVHVFYESEEELNRQLLVRLEAAEKQIAEKNQLLQAEKMDILDFKIRLDAEMKKIKTEFFDMLEGANWLNLELSKQAKRMKKSNSDLRRWLVRLQSDYRIMKNEFSQLKVQYAATKCELSELISGLQINNGEMKGDILEMMENCSTICDILSESSLNVEAEPAPQPESLPVISSCKDVQINDVYELLLFEPPVKSPTYVYCDADTDAGGWIVIMRRQDGSVDFNRNWNAYKNGFGNIYGDFWIGNNILHQITKSKPMELRVDMTYSNGIKVFAKYAEFKVGSESDLYVLTVSGYSGTAGDALGSKIPGVGYYFNGMKFSTFDQENAPPQRWNCAEVFRGGWWYNDCIGNTIMLTGRYHTGHMRMTWITDSWTPVNLTFAEMKIR